MPIHLPDHIARWASSPFGALAEAPWEIASRAPARVLAAMDALPGGYRRLGEVAIHERARLEHGASLKGPVIIGPGCFVSGSALLRGGVYLEADCVVGPGVELRSALLFRGARVAHLSFVGDSILGEDVNLEAGAVIANHRNELAEPRILIAAGGEVIDTGIDRFGALVGDRARLGANAVIAPGALLAPGTIVPRLGLVDQRPHLRPSSSGGSVGQADEGGMGERT
jgi:NDP-sugar pyrophosphorylase family protein